jgi:hypothetical protein
MYSTLGENPRRASIGAGDFGWYPRQGYIAVLPPALVAGIAAANLVVVSVTSRLAADGSSPAGPRVVPSDEGPPRREHGIAAPRPVLTVEAVS